MECEILRSPLISYRSLIVAIMNDIANLLLFFECAMGSHMNKYLSLTNT